MTKSVNLYLASGIDDDKSFWVVNFTEDDDILNSSGIDLLECYRKELFGINAASEVKEAINSTLDILAFDSKFDRYQLDDSITGYSSEIPINIIEDIFDLWAYNYNNENNWKKCIGLLKFRKKIKKNNDYINIGLKGDTYEFAKKLNKLLSLNSVDLSSRLDHNNELMW
ncbi:josephin [Prochlorococcus marinus]|uniref:josephin n=1 Tax=Prochlorococcus marinus TaxID=1219 RepID=UPI0022B3B2C4|nr:josephin [Prochlorococcus marinus]